MVTLSVSHIIYGAISVLLAILGFFLVRFFGRNDRRHDKTSEQISALYDKIAEINGKLDHLLGEHDSIKEQCKTKRRK